ncbi:glutamate cyclase domain-containing protein [Chelatococcus sp. GCM10030263]|uniref:glutamate cyclase domain-containing protein n=1 Tax=Chelatococcus sp. GCM10030263 TaxID=3273387 RepID=UPI00361D31BF
MGKEHADFIGENIDRLITVELKNLGMPHDIVRAMYEAAREEGGGRPLTTRAAEGLLREVSRGDVVFVVTGAGYPPGMPNGESDGPPGAAAIARALYWGLGAVPVFVCEQQHAGPIVASSEAATLMLRPREAAMKGFGAALETAPGTSAEVADWAASLYETYKPKALISVERLGPAADGIVYNATGIPKGPESGIVDLAPIFYEAEKRGVFSIGLGDHGNEMGFGRIREAVARIMPKGETLATVVKTDVLIPCLMSNWGAYGIEAALAFLLQDASLIHTPQQEERTIRKCLDAGGLEAFWCSTAFIVDSCDGESSMAIVQLLNNMVRLALMKPGRGVAH